MSLILKKNILSFDTAYQRVVASIQSGDHIFYLEKQDREKNSQTILPCLSQLMQKCALSFSDLHAIGVGVGPGRFTGLRVGICVAQGLSYAHHIPIIALPSLKILAKSVQAMTRRWIWVVMQAKMNYVYCGIYLASNLEQQSEEKIIAVANFHHDFAQFDPLLDVMICEDIRLLKINSNLNLQNCNILEKVAPSAEDLSVLALEYDEKGISISADKLRPHYVEDFKV